MLYQHQRDIIKEDKKKCGLFLGTGSAKTLTALHLAQGKILCITPKTQRDQQNFVEEAKKWGLKKDITQISKEDFKKMKLGQFDTIIVDEAHTIAGATPSIRYRNRQPIPKCSALYEMFMAYIQKYPPQRLYLLTATPTRSPMAVWAMAQILGHRWSFYEFRDIFYFSIRKGFREFWMPRKDQKERLGKAVRSLGYTGRLEDYFDVPEQTFRVEYFGLTKEQKQKLKEVETEFPDPLVQITKRHQVENGTLKGDEFSKDEFFDNEKIERLKDLAIEFPRLVIIAKYSNQIKQIAEALKEYNVLTLEGATKNRSELINKANRDEECIVIAQASVSAGWELPNYPVMVFASLSYSVVDRLQAIGRIHRANALKKNLYIDLVVKGGIDEEVYKAIQNKEDFVEHIYARKQK